MLPGWTRAWWLAETALDLLGPIADALRRRGQAAASEEPEEEPEALDWSEVEVEITLRRMPDGLWWASAPTEVFGAVGPQPTPWEAIAALVAAATR